MSKSLICVPNNAKYRFALGCLGERNLLVIALNPNTATATKHDSTTRNIEKIARDNGFDGWLLFNLSPVREAKPEHLLTKTDQNLYYENLRCFEEYVKDRDWNIENCWLAWGNGVLAKDYLKSTAIKMLDILEQKSMNYYCIRRTQQHHPYHSAQRVLNSFFKGQDEIALEDFPAQAYKKLILEYV